MNVLHCGVQNLPEGLVDHQDLREKLDAMDAQALLGGGEKAIERQHAVQEVAGVAVRT